MSKSFENAAGHLPISGCDIAITGYTEKLSVISFDWARTPEVTVLKDGAGDTKARVHSDIEQSRELSITCVVIGEEAAGAAANNAPIANATEITLTSTNHPHTAGFWTVQSSRQGQGNTDLATWVYTLKPKIT